MLGILQYHVDYSHIKHLAYCQAHGKWPMLIIVLINNNKPITSLTHVSYYSARDYVLIITILSFLLVP